jgi:hypothetical protein
VSDQVLHIVVDVSFADEAMRGHVSDGVQEPKPFSGWLGLIGALDTMMGSARQDSDVLSAHADDLTGSAGREGERPTADRAELDRR